MSVERVDLGDGLVVSSIGFGCAGIMQLPTRRARTRVLAAAVDAGMSHFDIARMYGLGAAESELGNFAKSVGRDQVTIATKFGIDAAGTARRLGRLQGPARAVLRRAPALRSAVKSRGGAFKSARTYDALKARISLDESLTALGVDHVDILFLHAPRPGDDVAVAELADFLSGAQRSGKIRAWGVSQDEGLETDIRGLFGAPALSQVRSDIVNPAPRTADIIFGVLNRAHAQIQSAFAADAVMQRQWEEELGLPLGTPNDRIRFLWAAARSAPGTKAVLYSSTSPQRIAEAAQIAPLDRKVMDRAVTLAQALPSGATL